MRKRFLWGIVFTTVFLFGFNITALAAGAADFTVENGVLTAYHGADTDIVIPADLGITAIGDSVFYGHTEMVSVTIPDGVASFGKSAFGDCRGLKSVTIPDSVVSIGENAFNGCGLKSVVLPDSVSSVGSGAFGFCNDLSSVKLSEGLTSISPWLFTSCSALKAVRIPGSVTEIGASAFEAAALRSIYIPDSVTSIAKDAFYGCYNLKQAQGITGIKGSYAQGYAKDALIFKGDGTFLAEKGVPFTCAAFAPSPVPLLISGQTVSLAAYNINGNNYFKLRDLAQALNGSAKQFAVEWDSAAQSVNLTSAKAYTPAGGELELPVGETKQIAAVATVKIYLNGSLVNIKAYNIGGYNYFKLRDLARAIDCSVTWDSSSGTIGMDTAKGYTN